MYLSKIPTDKADIKKIQFLFDDLYNFPIDDDDFNGLIGESNWKVALNQKCSFCFQSASFHNHDLNLFSCQDCYTKIQKQKNHPVSLSVNLFFKNWIDRNYWVFCDIELLYGKHQVKHNICFVCEQTLSQKCAEVCFTTVGDKCALAHMDCATEKGFTGFFEKTDYEEIIDFYENL